MAAFGYGPTLEWQERLHHRDCLRTARYSALADAEGFQEVCFALENLGLRLLQKKSDLGSYRPALERIAQDSVVLTSIAESFPGVFGSFAPLFDLVRVARNDAMHSGVYARHATQAAIELCIGLEEALMKEQQEPRRVVSDFMVKNPVIIEAWQPVAYARQLMLMHSFSYIPVFIDRSWHLLSEGALARYMRSGKWADLLAATVEHAAGNGLRLVQAQVVALNDDVHDLLEGDADDQQTRLWLVAEEARSDRLCGILSPFELI